MSRRIRTLWAVMTSVTLFAAGCTPSKPFYFFDDKDMSHYRGVATELEFPDSDDMSLADVENATEPLTLSNKAEREIWDLTLEEAIQTSLTNSKVMRNLGGLLFVPGLPGANQNISPTGTLLNSPQSIQTVYNPALVESDPRFGTEAALSQFDTQFNTSLLWQKNDRPVNFFFGGLLAGVLEQDTGALTTELAKTTATGSRLFIRHHDSYEFNNNPSNRFPSAWNTDIEAEFRHPLLQGAGTSFNRIAGPNAVAGVYNGVVLARINTDIALADFEAGVRNLVADVERSYWDLYFHYRSMNAVLAGRDSALQTWRKVYALYANGAKGGEAEKEAQAREQYFLFRAQVENQLSTLYTAESRLRYMMGLAASDGRLIRPADEPTTANIEFDWSQILPESLARSAEVRRQKWVVKQRELQLTAARNFLLPRLDASGIYRWRGFGNDLINSNRSPVQFDNAWQELTGGEFQEWQMGVNLNVPIGFRQGLSAVRNAELQLARERAMLQDQELELTHQLTNAIRDLDRNYALSQTNFNRRVAAQKQVEAVRAAYETDTVTLDLLLDAQRRLAEAEIAYFRALVDHNVGVLQVHYRKGSLLEYNGVYLAEGPWPAKAYFDARKRARERDAALFMNYGFTRPNVFSRGPLEQRQDGGQIFDAEGGSTEFESEMAPTPAPMPAEIDEQARAADEGSAPANGQASAPIFDSPQMETRREALNLGLAGPRVASRSSGEDTGEGIERTSHHQARADQPRQDPAWTTSRRGKSAGGARVAPTEQAGWKATAGG